ncbi:hypothetical protein MRX96_016259 [Rhipicephalus microplus]
MFHINLIDGKCVGVPYAQTGNLFHLFVRCISDRGETRAGPPTGRSPGLPAQRGSSQAVRVRPENVSRMHDGWSPAAGRYFAACPENVEKDEPRIRLRGESGLGLGQVKHGSKCRLQGLALIGRCVGSETEKGRSCHGGGGCAALHGRLIRSTWRQGSCACERRAETGCRFPRLHVGVFARRLGGGICSGDSSVVKRLFGVAAGSPRECTRAFSAEDPPRLARAALMSCRLVCAAVGSLEDDGERGVGSARRVVSAPPW